MSALFEISRTTVTLDGDEQDAPVRGWIDIEQGRAFFDSEPQVYVSEAWCDVSELELAPDDQERIEQALADVAFEDDGRGE